MNNDNEPEINVPEEAENAGLPLVVHEEYNQPPAKAASTPQQMRVIEVSEALAPAYAKASTLELTEAEINGLMLPFPDEKVEVRPHDGLIYIPHIHVSNRLNQVFNPGQWSLICRRHWLDGNTMYGEYILLIRGCYVGESVGGHPYQPNNPKVNYSDTLESTAAEALRRICGKRLSCGSQVWDPSYAESWCQKYRGYSGGKYFKAMKASPPPPPPKDSPPAAKKAPPSADSCRKRMVKNLLDLNKAEEAWNWLVKIGWLLESEGLEKLEDRYVPRTEEQWKAFLEKLEKFIVDGSAEKPYEPVWEEPKQKKAATPAGDPDDKSAPWRSFPFPFGKNAGIALADMDKGQLWYWWNTYKVETHFNKDGKKIPLKAETIAKSKKLREALDACGIHYQFKSDGFEEENLQEGDES